MGFFAVRSRQETTSLLGVRVQLTERIRSGLPPRFIAVAEALASGSDTLEPCEVAGRELASDGQGLDESLELLRQTYHTVLGIQPTFSEVRALGVAWSEATLAYLHQVSCEDPLTGLASTAHLRSRLSEIYRGQSVGARPPRESHALVIVDLPSDFEELLPARGSEAQLSRALRLTQLGASARTVFPGPEPLARIGATRIAVLAARDDLLVQRVSLLRRLATAAQAPGSPVRVWIEGLPGHDAHAAALLDELSRP
jgi:hypothetical protein